MSRETSSLQIPAGRTPAQEQRFQAAFGILHREFASMGDSDVGIDAGLMAPDWAAIITTLKSLGKPLAKAVIQAILNSGVLDTKGLADTS